MDLPHTLIIGFVSGVLVIFLSKFFNSLAKIFLKKIGYTEISIEEINEIIKISPLYYFDIFAFILGFSYFVVILYWLIAGLFYFSSNPQWWILYPVSLILLFIFYPMFCITILSQMNKNFRNYALNALLKNDLSQSYLILKPKNLKQEIILYPVLVIIFKIFETILNNL